MNPDPRDQSPPQIRSFADFTLDLSRGCLFRDGHEIKLRPKSYETLKYLVENPGRVLTKHELIQAIWPDSFVTDDSLVQCLREVRRALGDESQQYIKTLPRRGYIFDANVDQPPHRAPAVLTEQVEGVKLVIERDQGAFGGRWKFLVALVILVCGGFLLIRSIRQSRLALASPAVAPFTSFQKIQPTQLTNLGSVMGIAISPDGRYVVYTLEEAGRQSLWLRQIDTNSSQQIAAPAPVNYYQLLFSPDGQYLYYASRPTQYPVVSIYRIPLLGGVPSKLIENTEGYFALSPDSKQICFVRDSTTDEQSRLMVAVISGAERQLATRKMPQRFRYPAWSPDNRVVIASVGNFDAEGSLVEAIEVGLSDRHERLLTGHLWPSIDQKVWLPDGSGLFMIAGDQMSRPYQRQVWFLSYPEGNVRQLTNDVSSYLCLSLTKDSTTLATLETRLEANIWVASASNSGRAAKVASGAGGFSWTPDGRIVYGSHASGSKEIWVMNADGSGRQQLTSSNGFNTSPAVSPDGSQIVFASDRAGSLNLWRMKIDGSDLAQLTSGGGEDYPRFSPDGRYLVYSSVGNWRLWRMPAAGGDPVSLSNDHAEAANVSPDGNWFASLSRDEQTNSEYQIIVAPFDSGAAVKKFRLPKDSIYQAADVRWAPDGQALTYVVTEAGISNVWRQPLAGGEPTRITNFEADKIFHFDLSRDGQELVCSRGRWAHDVVLIKGVRPPTAEKQN